jgi:Leucine-rich repeat (LRR) protein
MKTGTRRVPAPAYALLCLLLSATDGARSPNAVADEITAQQQIESIGGRCRAEAPGQPITEIDLSGNNIGNSALRLVAEFPQLTALDISATRIDDKGLRELLPRLPKLRSLRARGCSVGDGALAALGGCQDLRTLDLTGSQITDAGLAQLSACEKLEELDLTGTAVTDDGIVPVVLPNLRVLKLFATRVRGPGVWHFTTLVSLDLRATAVDDEGLNRIAGLTNLEELDLSRSRVASDGLRHLSGMPRLRKLRLANSIDPNRGKVRTKVLDTAPLAEIPNLRELDLADSIDVMSLPSLSKLANLERLTIVENCGEFWTIEGPEDFSDIKRRAAEPPQGFLGSLKSLKELQLVSCYSGNMRRSEQWLAAIGRLPALESLDLFESSINTEGLKHLSGLQTLRRLNLLQAYGWDFDLAPLTALTGLQVLELSYPTRGQLDLNTLAPMRQLQVLRVADAYIPDEVRKKFPDAHPKVELLAWGPAESCSAYRLPAAAASGISAAEACDNLWVVQAQVEPLSRANPLQAPQLQVTHVYSGPSDLLGRTFTASGSRWELFHGSYDVRDASQLHDGRLESGEPGIWFMASENGRLVYTEHALNLAAPFRPAPRDWCYTTDDFLAAKRMAEQFAVIAAAAAEDRLHLLAKAAVGDSHLMSELAVQIIAQTKKPIAVATLHKLADKLEMPLRGQLAVDESLRRLDPGSWIHSEDRHKMISHWIQHWQESEFPRWIEHWYDSPAVVRIHKSILADVHQQRKAPKDIPPIIGEFLLARSISAEARGEILTQLTDQRLLPTDLVRKELLTLIGQAKDEGIRLQAAGRLAFIMDLDDDLKTRLTAIAKRETSPMVRHLIEDYLFYKENGTDNEWDLTR